MDAEQRRCCRAATRRGDHENVSMPERMSSLTPEPTEAGPAKEIESKNDVQVGKLTPEVKEPAPKPKQVAKRTADYREQQRNTRWA